MSDQPDETHFTILNAVSHYLGTCEDLVRNIVTDRAVFPFIEVWKADDKMLGSICYVEYLTYDRLAPVNAVLPTFRIVERIASEKQRDTYVDVGDPDAFPKIVRILRMAFLYQTTSPS